MPMEDEEPEEEGDEETKAALDQAELNARMNATTPEVGDEESSSEDEEEILKKIEAKKKEQQKSKKQEKWDLIMKVTWFILFILAFLRHFK